MKKISKIIFIGIITVFNFCYQCFAQYSKILDFNGASNGNRPFGNLISDSTFLYGMTQKGGANNGGLIFKIKHDGTGYVVLMDFNGASNGYAPEGALMSDSTYLYGTTSTGGTNNMGVIFKIKPDGTGYSKLFDFTGSANGSNPTGSLISDGTFLYGMTNNGGANAGGALFKIMTDGTGYSNLLDFSGAVNGNYPGGTLIFDGTFLYGMTYYGGSNNMGVIFKVKTDGTGYSKLLDFTGATNGSHATYGSLISDGTYLYGTTIYGGTGTCPYFGYTGCGVIFKIKTDGTGYSKLLDFADTPDGKWPLCTLFSDGTFLYGMTSSGGTNTCGAHGCGIVFKIKPDGTGYSKLLDFAGIANGDNPYGSLISDGTFLYGMTTYGGTGNCPSPLGGCGTIFKLNPYCTAITFSQTINICAGQNLIVGTNIYTTSGVYTDVLTSLINFCDSTVTTNLTINDISVSVSNTTLTANAFPATYQWINCNNGNTPIAGQTNQSFVATANGSYAVIVNLNGCSDTSSCFNITTIGVVENNFAFTVNIYPNPFNSQTIIAFGQEQIKSTVVIMDMLGKEIKVINFSGTQCIIEKGEMKEGIYFLQIKDQNKNVLNRKIIVQ